MNKSSIRYVCLSDIHVGHRRTPTEHIVKSLNAFLDAYTKRDDLDIIFIVGDMFDRLLDFPEDDIHVASEWIARLFRYCVHSGVKLRVLEGTPSHDWKQSKVFLTLQTAIRSPVDLKYIDTLHIEHMEDLGIHVLYVPDEWNSSTEKTFEQVQGLLAEHHLEQVDVCCLHGSFGYQLPAAATKAPRHNEANYLSVVKHFINTGHIHTFSTFERIIATGSFERLAHGEEEPKGGVECVIKQNGDDEFYFIENKLAKIYLTINLKFRDIDRCLTHIENKTKGLPNDSMIRLRGTKDHPGILGIDEIRKQFPFFIFSKITLEEEEEAASHDLISMIDDDELSYTPITITRDNIKTLLFEGIRAKHQFSEDQLTLAESLLETVI